MEREAYLQVGVITSTHGIRGEVKVFPTTDDPARFDDLRKVLLDTGKERIPLELERVRYFKQYVIVKFRGIDNINDVEGYCRMPLLVSREDAVPLAEDEYFIADLLGLTVATEEDEILGTLKDVLQTGANDIYQVRTPEGKELLIPAIRDCVREIDFEAGRMTVHLLDGLRQE